jgi:cytochrome c5
MSRRSLVLLLIAVGLLLLGLAAVACGGGGEEPPAPPPAEEPSGDLGGEELLEARCTMCHSLDRVKAASKNLDQWASTVERMRGLGAELTDGEADIRSEYLSETYGP